MKLLHERITEYAAMFPDKTALTDAGGVKSYRELEAESARAALALRSMGIRKGDRAAVYVPYTKDILLGTVSALRAGAVFIPMDDAYPPERLEYMLADSEARAVVTVRELWEKKPLDFPGEKVLFLDALPREDVPADFTPPLSEEDPAMLLYTSGTTGNPKGILHSHRMLVHIADWMNSCDGAAMNCDTRSGVMSSFSFVGTQMFLQGPLINGGTVCIAPEEARKDLGALDRFLCREAVTHMFLPSSLAAILAEDYDISGRNIFAAGEKLRNFRPHAAGNFLINSYGSTELGGVMATKIFGDEETISVGKPWNNMFVRLADESGEIPAACKAGELLVSSAFMSREYYNLPDLSTEKWILTDETLWFRTGDRALCTPEGNYVILGRTDNMVKLRGFRIETGEVEAQVYRAAAGLCREDVGEIAVVVKSVSGTEHLVCYYEAGEELDEKAVTEVISRRLAEYMIPDIWVRLDAFPRNANGKILRKELPQPGNRHRTSGVLDSEVISRLVLTAADLLNPAGFIGPDDRFTDLGGTSLTAMQYAARLRGQGIRVSGLQVLKLNVLRRIAEAAEVTYEALWTPEEYDAVRKDFALRGERIERVLPISSRQDEMLFMQILQPDRADFRNTWFLQLDSPVSETNLRKAMDFAAQENESLRAAVVFHDVSVVQQVITDRRIPLQMIEESSFGTAEIAALRRQIADAPVDLQRDSLVRVYGIHAGEKNFLCVTAYGITVDEQQLRAFIAGMLDALSKDYPEDVSIRDWSELLKPETDHGERQVPKEVRIPGTPLRTKGEKPEICVYTHSSKPKLVFVHTGNTGSEAYYRLADRLGEAVSFSVIEPYNLYHPEKAICGIKNIAKKYIRILKEWQPEGPYLLGGWCYGGIVAHEMACHLEQAGEEVRHLYMLDSHALDSRQLRKLARGMFAGIDRHYFETCPLFAELRADGMLDAMVANAARVAEDIQNHIPSVFHGEVTYFKPEQIPAGVMGDNARYWQKMTEYEAGNFEHYCSRERLRIIRTPHEHDLMMDDPSLDLIVPAILETIG